MIAGFVLDTIITVLESFLFSYSVNYFCNDKKIDKKKLIITFILLVTITSLPILKSFKVVWISHIMSYVLLFIIVGIVYRKDLKKALICMLVLELIILSITTIVRNNFYNIFMVRHVFRHSRLYLLCVVGFFRAVSAILQIKYIDKMCLLYKTILDEGNYLFIFIIILFAWSDLFNISDNYMCGLNNESLKSMLNVWFLLFLVFALLYIIKISSKSREIGKLNSDLQDNNNKLRKIKHDYGAQISYFYGLCLMKRQDDLKSALKEVIDRTKYSNNISLQKCDSILHLALEMAVRSTDVNVTMEEMANLHKLVIPEIELFRILSNIASNAVEAMQGKGNIFAKSYQLEDQVIILIQNDGPEIPKDMLLNIFKTGFTTKDNTEKGHGFGLSIVKELVEKYDGQISVASSEELTEFRIVFKCNK